MRRIAQVLFGAILLTLLVGIWSAVAGRLFPGTAPQMVARSLQAGQVVIDKTKREMTLYRDGNVMKSYDIALGPSSGPKEQEGDGRTPEGVYDVDWRNSRSRYHLSLHISYPSPAQEAAAQAEDRDPGGDIMIHGLPNGWAWFQPVFHGRNWTNGCIAVTNSEIREIWSLVPNGTLIEIRS